VNFGMLVTARWLFGLLCLTGCLAVDDAHGTATAAGVDATPMAAAASGVAGADLAVRMFGRANQVPLPRTVAGVCAAS
jgi:hypothetical protein